MVLPELMRMLQRFARDEEGQGLVEYGLVIALVAIAVIGVLTAMGGQLQALFNKVITTLSGATS